MPTSRRLLLTTGGLAAVAAVAALVAPGATASPPVPDAPALRVPRIPIATLPFARTGSLPIYWPAAKVVRFTYHESLFGTALPLRPYGTAGLIDNPSFRRPPRSTGPRYIVMSSRGRGTRPTTAADVVLKRGTKVLAPVSGRVVSVTPYLLYCNRYDERIIIKPKGARNTSLVMFHVDRVRVKTGDRVIHGTTVLGIPRVFVNGDAQYDGYIGGSYPHVHIEVERGNARPVPGCRR